MFCNCRKFTKHKIFGVGTKSAYSSENRVSSWLLCVPCVPCHQKFYPSVTICPNLHQVATMNIKQPALKYLSSMCNEGGLRESQRLCHRIIPNLPQLYPDPSPLSNTWVNFDFWNIFVFIWCNKSNLHPCLGKRRLFCLQNKRRQTEVFLSTWF